MAKVNLTPFASSMHVEGETGGGGGSPVITVVGTTLVTPIEEIVSMYTNHTIPSAIVEYYNEDDPNPSRLIPITHFSVYPSEEPTIDIQAHDLYYHWDSNSPYLSYFNMTITNYEDWTYLEVPVVKTMGFEVKNLDYPD